jgi:hypothetical protein
VSRLQWSFPWTIFLESDSWLGHQDDKTQNKKCYQSFN